MINSHASASVEKDRLRHKTWYKQNSFSQFTNILFSRATG
jgi:hypothetical protein